MTSSTRDIRPIYLDYMASTPIDGVVQQAMMPFLTTPLGWGNASAHHYYGQQLTTAVLQAAQDVATYINVQPNEIIWTSGATEAINLALKGAAYYYRRQGRHVIATTMEHPAVLATLEALSLHGFTVSLVPPTAEGLLDLDALASYIRKDTILISVTHVNSEIGTIQDIVQVGRLAKQHGLLLHVDAAQSPGKVAIDCAAASIDLLSLSAHKVYGPVGIGALYVRRQPKVQLIPQIHGGDQQGGVRSGSLPVASIVGMGAAFRVAHAQLADDRRRIADLNTKLRTQLSVLPGIVWHGATKQRVPHNLNFSIIGIDRNELLKTLPDIAVSTASACRGGLTKPSHVLQAIGVDDRLAENALRISIGRYTTAADVEQVGVALCTAIARLQRRSRHV